MTRIAVYPALESEADAADVLARLSWHFAPYADVITSIAVVTPFPADEIARLAAPYYLDPAAALGNTSEAFRSKLSMLRATGIDVADWTGLFDRQDMVIVWRLPDPASGACDPFASLDELKEAIGDDTKLLIADRQVRASEASLLLTAGLELRSDIDPFVAQSRERFTAFSETITTDICHVFGTGPSLSQVDAHDFADGDVISCNSFVANQELMAKLTPKVICAADPIFHAGPSSYAAAFRHELVKRLAEYDFYLFVPMRDYFVHRHYIPEEFHDRLIGLPYQRGDVNLDLKAEFHVAPLPNVLTLMMMPIGASCYSKMSISGCDGRPISEDQYFWGHHKASQFNDKMADIKAAHPGFFKIDYNDYYLKHCDQVEEICRKYEDAGGEVWGETASFVPALRKREAAEPLRQPRYARRDAPVTVLSLNPDLVDKVGHFWNYESKLAPIIAGRDCDYRVAANSRVGDDMVEEVLTDGTVRIDGVTVDPCLDINSWTLANRIGERRDSFEDVEAEVAAEFRRAIDRARAACDGELIVYMYTGSFEHLNILYQISRDRPDVRIVVNFFWLKTSSIWSPRFASNYGWLLEVLQSDSRVFATAMTKHQQRELQARTSYRIPVAQHPSPLISDADARRIIAEPLREQSDQFRIFFPSADRVEKGSELLYDTARHLASMFRGENCRIAFRTNPLDADRSDEEESALGEYRVLAGHIDEQNFVEILQTADVIVLPYLPPDFADRTSGLLIDSLYAGTPVVTLGGTWLAECADEFGFGKVVNIAEPEHIARAVYDIAHAAKNGELDMSAAASAYFQANSWEGLGDQILNGTQSASSVHWTAEESEQAETLRELASPLIGQISVEADARLNALDLVMKACQDSDGGRLVASGIQEPDCLLTGAKAGWGGHILESDPLHYGAILDATGDDNTPWTIHDHRPSAGKATGSPAVTVRRLLQDTENNRFDALVVADAEVDLIDPITYWADQVSPEYLVLGFLSGAHEQPARRAWEMANSLHQRGYQVLIAEHWHPRRTGERCPLRRITLFPYMPSRPGAVCKVIALRQARPLRELKALLEAACENAEYREVSSPEAIAAQLWAGASPAPLSSVLAAVERPGGKDWPVSGIEPGDMQPDGFRELTETEQKRVHRAHIEALPSLGLPLTFGIDIEKRKARFISLWLTDKQSKLVGEAIFDLELAKSVSVRNVSPLIEGEPFAGIAALNDDDSDYPRFHVWLSISKYNSDQPLLAQLVLRESAAGSAQYEGSAERDIAVRNAIVSATDVPVIYTQPAGDAREVGEAATARPNTESAPVGPDRNKEEPAPQGGLRSTVQRVSAEKVGRFGLFWKREDSARGSSIDASLPRRGAAPADPQARKLAETRQRNLIELGFSADPTEGWCVGDGVIVRNGDGGIRLDRNGAGHRDQFFTVLPVIAGRDYLIDLDIDELDPRVVVLVDGQVKSEMRSPNNVQLKATAGSNQMRVELKAVDSHSARFHLRRAQLISPG